MAAARQTAIIWFIILIGLCGIVWVSNVTDDRFDMSKTVLPAHLVDTWVIRLAKNLLGYATLIVPGYILLRYVRRVNYAEQADRGCTHWMVKLFFIGGSNKTLLDEANKPNPHEWSTSFQEAAILIFCFIGLQVSYLSWGILQEKLMTTEYTDAAGSKNKFSDSQFLVFVNRILAFVLSGFYVLCTRQPAQTAPLYKCSYCSFSNIMSSWCQYEALKYVSFPTQVLAKASKIIPVMLMGKLVSRTKYDLYEYVTAGCISVGMALFLFGNDDMKANSNSTTFSGIVILAGYMIFDSFTSNWQSELYSKYHMSSVQMMCTVNLFSCLFTSVSLLQQGGFMKSLTFMSMYHTFVVDIVILSVCSAMGQFVIFYTVYRFGAVVFVTMMTIRQGLAILLSCLIYSHRVTVVGAFGISMVFISIFVKMYISQRLKAKRKLAAGSLTEKV